MSDHDSPGDESPTEIDGASTARGWVSPIAASSAQGRIIAWLRDNRARLEILAIAAIALGGIVCMCLATFLIVWRLNNE